MFLYEDGHSGPPISLSCWCHSLGKFIYFFFKFTFHFMFSLPSSKQSTCNAGDAKDVGLNSWSGSSLRGGNGNPLQYSCMTRLNVMVYLDFYLTNKVYSIKIWCGLNLNFGKALHRLSIIFKAGKVFIFNLANLWRWVGKEQPALLPPQLNSRHCGEIQKLQNFPIDDIGLNLHF